MADEVSTTVKTTSDGMVKITLERYEELVSQAAVKPAQIVHRTVNRTPEVQAKDNVALGATFLGIGVGLIAVGAYRLSFGLKALKDLAK